MPFKVKYDMIVLSRNTSRLSWRSPSKRAFYMAAEKQDRSYILEADVAPTFRSADLNMV